jgi:hypothetical protein
LSGVCLLDIHTTPRHGIGRVLLLPLLGLVEIRIGHKRAQLTPYVVSLQSLQDAQLPPNHHNLVGSRSIVSTGPMQRFRRPNPSNSGLFNSCHMAKQSNTMYPPAAQLLYVCLVNLVDLLRAQSLHISNMTQHIRAHHSTPGNSANTLTSMAAHFSRDIACLETLPTLPSTSIAVASLAQP